MRAAILSAALLLASCSAIPVSPGLSMNQIDKVPEIRQSIIDFLPEERSKKVRNSLAYFDWVALELESAISKGLTLDQLVLENEDVVKRIPGNAAAIYDEIIEHSSLTDAVIPETLTKYYVEDLVPLMDFSEDLIDATDNFRKVEDVLEKLKPIAIDSIALIHAARR